MLAVVHGNVHTISDGVKPGCTILTALRISREFGFPLTIEHCTEGHLVAEELAAAGVRCTLGPLITGKSKQELKDRSLEAAAGMSHQGALRALTLDGARLVGLEHRIGSLEAGKDADCFITDGDLLDPRTRVLATFVDGQLAWSAEA